MSFATLLFLAHFVARALALVWGRQFVRVATKGTIEQEHLRCTLRRLHEEGKIGASGDGVLPTMRKLVHVVCAVARFDGFCPVETGDRAPVRRLHEVAGASLCAAPVFPNDSS